MNPRIAFLKLIALKFGSLFVGLHFTQVLTRTGKFLSKDRSQLRDLVRGQRNVRSLQPSQKLLQGNLRVRKRGMLAAPVIKGGSRDVNERRQNQEAGDQHRKPVQRQLGLPGESPDTLPGGEETGLRANRFRPGAR
jgi:hypothetical protein